ncbi:hypothetical protein [Streptomyces turgidiscabies]|uniref:hypothetical protein n=1 Tax=Streptomyces turgidiscabies TaxID=85558 RepID=UPI0038F8079C
MTTTSDPLVFVVILATAGAWLLTGLLLKHFLDKPCTYTPAEQHTRTPAFPTALADSRPHAQPVARDETTPLTNVQLDRARHRKGSRWT